MRRIAQKLRRKISATVMKTSKISRQTTPWVASSSPRGMPATKWGKLKTMIQWICWYHSGNIYIYNHNIIINMVSIWYHNQIIKKKWYHNGKIGTRLGPAKWRAYWILLISWDFTISPFHLAPREIHGIWMCVLQAPTSANPRVVSCRFLLKPLNSYLQSINPSKNLEIPQITFHHLSPSSCPHKALHKTIKNTTPETNLGAQPSNIVQRLHRPSPATWWASRWWPRCSVARYRPAQPGSRCAPRNGLRWRLERGGREGKELAGCPRCLLGGSSHWVSGL